MGGQVTLVWIARLLFGLTTLVALALTWVGLRRGMREQNWMLGPFPLVGSAILTVAVVIVCETGVRHEQVNEALAVYGMGVFARCFSIWHDWRVLRKRKENV